MKKYCRIIFCVVIFCETTVFGMDSGVTNYTTGSNYKNTEKTFNITACLYGYNFKDIIDQGKTAEISCCNKFIFDCCAKKLKNDNFLVPFFTDKQKEYALLWATQRRSYPKVKELISVYNVNPNADNPLKLSPLTIALHNEDYQMVQILADKDCRVNNAAEIPGSIIAIYTKDYKALQKCIDSNCFNPMYICEDWNNNNVLHIAASLGDIGICKILLDQKAIAAQVNCVNNKGDSPLAIALQNRHWEVANLFVRYSDLSQHLENIKTLFFLACKENNVKAIMLMKKYQLDNMINVCNKDGDSLLHIAVQHGSAEVVAALVCMSGININAINKQNKAPLDLAQHNSKISELLKTHGGLLGKNMVK
ncbi:MAG TPA: ankyrin repeat domain-containing protein [Candidatus Babeliales bacterium]|nr:ankyrin repeat domain-containing protein [Candidatus Babeliales bacterium]